MAGYGEEGSSGGSAEPQVADPFLEEGNDIEGAQENAQTPGGGTD